MIPLLLAQAAAVTASKSIFEHDVVKGGVLVLVLGILGYLARGLNLLRTVRQDVTAEVSMQQRENERKETAGRIPQPLEVKQHTPFVTLDKHQTLERQMSELKEQRRKDVAGLHIKIEDGLRNVRHDLATEFKEVREENTQSRLAVARLEKVNEAQSQTLSRVQNTLESMPEKIANQLRK